MNKEEEEGHAGVMILLFEVILRLLRSTSLSCLTCRNAEKFKFNPKVTSSPSECLVSSKTLIDN